MADRAIAWTSTALERLADRLSSLAARVRRLARCARCGFDREAGEHVSVEQCESWLAEEGKLGCPSPLEHHAFRRRWWIR